MNKRVYFLMIVSFVVGMVELIIGGILGLIAEDLQVSLRQAGLLSTTFSLIFAIAGPTLLIITAKIERQRLSFRLLLFLFLGSIVTIVSPTYCIRVCRRLICPL